MENFEPGTKCPWSGHIFSVNDRGRKCPRCERAITLSAWQEKGRCFCGTTSLVEAVARSSIPTRISRTTRPQPSPANSSSPTVSRPTRTTTSSVQSTSSTTSSSYSPASDSSSSGWVYLTLLLFFITIVFGMCTSQSNQQSRTRPSQSQSSAQPQNNPSQDYSRQSSSRLSQPQSSAQPQNNPSQDYPSWNFPRSKCGDSDPPGFQTFYPVYVNRTDESTLRYIKSNYCIDAYLMTRQSVNRKSIQAASFRSKKRAFELSRIMLRDPRINSAEVGSTSLR